MDMKKILSVILTVLTVLPMSLIGAGTVSAETPKPSSTVVYVKDGGNGDGKSAASPLGNLSEAYNALGDAGGRIVICGKLTLTGAFQEPVHEGLVIVTQNWDDLDYRPEGSLYTGGASRRYILNGPTQFENIRFTTTNKQGLFFICNNNYVTMDQGIIAEGFDCSLIANAVTVLGGRQNGLAPLKDRGYDSHITVKSGTFLIAGMNRQMTTTDNTGTAYIDIYGGEIKTLYGGSVNGGTTAGANINIYGGKFTGKVDCGYGVVKNLTVNLNNGDFSACTSVTGSTSAESKITIAKSVEDSVMSKVSLFKTIETSEGVKTTLIPEEVFGAGSFTASNGKTLPYRVYFPAGYDKSADKEYPVFFYFHGNGSRGTDNKLQLGNNHAVVSKVLNSGTDCIIVAPQCPSSPNAWILDNGYPGGKGFDPEKKATSPHLEAAIELCNKFLAEEKIDKTRIYVSGGSNGAAACWSLISRSPYTVAGAIILAGTGSTGAAERVAANCLSTPIWTFHGDADKTLSVEGTRQIVNKINELGGTLCKYTEMPGYDHNIWVDAVNMDGVIDWMLSQKRTDSVGVFSQVLDKDAKPAEPADKPSTDSNTGNTDEQTAPVTTPDTDAGKDGQNNSPILPIAIAAGALAAVGAVLAIVFKKKKK